MSSNRRVIGHFDASEDALAFANSKWAEDLCGLGTSCPDHFLRTRISPMFVPWDPATEDVGDARASDRRARSRVPRGLRDVLQGVRRAGVAGAARQQSVGRRRFPGLGLFGFGKDKREARITTEFFVNAIHVMQGANALEEDGAPPDRCRRCGGRNRRSEFKTFHNYVALPRLEAFRIEYWALEEAKLQRMPPEKEFSRKVVVVVGGGSGIGREVGAADRRSAAGTSWWPTPTARRRRTPRKRPPRLSVGGDGAGGDARSDLARHASRPRCARPCCSSAASTP